MRPTVRNLKLNSKHITNIYVNTTTNVSKLQQKLSRRFEINERLPFCPKFFLLLLENQLLKMKEQKNTCAKLIKQKPVFETKYGPNKDISIAML